VPYLVDGNNLCGAGRDRRLGLPTDQDDMVRLLNDFATRRSTRLTVVFDGPAAAGRVRGSPGRVRVLHSGAGRTADDTIVALAGGTSAPRDITLVSSDRELGARVRALGCRVMGCRQFAETVHRARARSGDEKPAAVDIDLWERYFAGED
jgi:predicted RNA-binding protein with PIN domain